MRVSAAILGVPSGEKTAFAARLRGCREALIHTAFVDPDPKAFARIALGRAV